MRLMHPMGPTLMALESLAIAFAVISVIAIAGVVTVYAFFWAIERFAYWGRRNRRSLNELRDILHEQAALSPRRTGGPQRNHRSRETPERVGIARSVSGMAVQWLSFNDINLLVAKPVSVADWLPWLRKAEKGGQTILAALIDNTIGVMLAYKGEFKDATAHFTRAAEAFETISHSLSVGQITILALEQLAALGHNEADHILSQARNLLQSSPILRMSAVELVTRNNTAARIHQAAPRGVALYKQGAEAYARGDNADAAYLFAGAGDDFEANLANQWFNWPLAAARNDQVVANLFAEGYGYDAGDMLWNAFSLAETAEVPSERLREYLRENVQLAGLIAR